MTTQQPEALQLAFECEESAFHWVNEIDTRSKAAKMLRAQHARIAELEDDLQFVERWAVHHGSKPSISAEEALSCIQHYPAIHEITKSYKDGKRPDTFNPYARIAELEGQLEAIGAGGVEPLRTPALQVLINFDQVGTAGPFAVVDGRVRLPAETMMDLARMLKPTSDAMAAAPQAVQAAYPHLPHSVADVVDFMDGRGVDVDFSHPAPAGGTSLYTAAQMHAYVDADRAQRAATSPEIVKLDRGFRWDSEKQHHVPTLLIEFTPVPANSPNTEKGWADRDALAAALAAPAHPAEGVPAQTEALRAELEEATETADSWRRLALQFDNHRMQALGHLRELVRIDDGYAEAKSAEQFLAAPPLDGEAVLAQRIATLAAATQPAAQGMDAQNPQNAALDLSERPTVQIHWAREGDPNVLLHNVSVDMDGSCTTAGVLEAVAAAINDYAKQARKKYGGGIPWDTMNFTNVRMHSRDADGYGASIDRHSVIVVPNKTPHGITISHPDALAAQAKQDK